MNKYDMTIGVNSELVRDLGGGLGAVTAAMLYNMVQYIGYEWGIVRPIDFERRTSFGEKTFRAAQQRLIEAGLVEKKVGYIPGSTAKATFLRLVPEDTENPTTSVTQPVSSGSSNRKALPRSNRGGNNNIDNYISRKGQNLPFGPSTSSDGLAPLDSSNSDIPPSGFSDTEESSFSSLTESERSERKGLMGGDSQTAAPADPFAEPTTEPVIFSVKPGKQANEENSKAGAVRGEVVKICKARGYRIADKDPRLFTIVKARLKDYSSEDIITATNNYFNSPKDFQSQFGLTAALSEGMFDTVLNNKFGGKQQYDWRNLI